MEKDAEAAMALSLGKPVIFYCGEERRRDGSIGTSTRLVASSSSKQVSRWARW